MNGLLIFPVVAPLVAAALSTIFHNSRITQRVLSIITVCGSLAVAILLLLKVNADGPQVTDLGGWPVPVGIALVADLFSTGKKGGIQRDNYFIASRFYLGGDGILPRQDVAWGIAGYFFEVK